MSSSVDTLKELLNDLSSLTPEKLSSFTEQMVQYFVALKEKLSSQEEPIRQKALDEALEMKEFLQVQLDKISAKTGIAPQEFLSYLQKEGQNPALADAQKNIEKMEHLFKQPPAEKSHKVKKDNKVKLYG